MKEVAAVLDISPEPSNSTSIGSWSCLGVKTNAELVQYAIKHRAHLRRGLLVEVGRQRRSSGDVLPRAVGRPRPEPVDPMSST